MQHRPIHSEDELRIYARNLKKDELVEKYVNAQLMAEEMFQQITEIENFKYDLTEGKKSKAYLIDLICHLKTVNECLAKQQANKREPEFQGYPNAIWDEYVQNYLFLKALGLTKEKIQQRMCLSDNNYLFVEQLASKKEGANKCQ